MRLLIRGRESSTTRTAVGADEVSSGSLWSGTFASASVDSMHFYDSIIARMFAPWTHDLIDRGSGVALVI
jgi:hypothetical protein